MKQINQATTTATPSTKKGFASAWSTKRDLSEASALPPDVFTRTGRVR